MSNNKGVVTEIRNLARQLDLLADQVRHLSHNPQLNEDDSIELHKISKVIAAINASMSGMPGNKNQTKP
jgi:hypothetical protein